MNYKIKQLKTPLDPKNITHRHLFKKSFKAVQSENDR